LRSHDASSETPATSGQVFVPWSQVIDRRRCSAGVVIVRAIASRTPRRVPGERGTVLHSRSLADHRREVEEPVAMYVGNPAEPGAVGDVQEARKFLLEAES
jgi:hypothetical protein